jgi:HEAT repeat protein
MKTCLKTKVIHLAAIALFSLSVNVSAQSDTSDVEALREAAVEALITAPPERALPLARKVVEGDYSNDLKEKALFVLSQIDEPEAQDIVLSVARNESGDLQEEAIRMIGISGNPDAMAQLGTMFVEGDEDVREAVLEAYLIADDEDAVYQIAINAQDEDIFEQAVEMLGVMGAHDKLRQLRDQVPLGDSEVSGALIEAYAISGDLESLKAWAMDSSDTKRQVQAIEGLGIVGSDDADAVLAGIYRSSDDEEVKEAAVEGLMISGNDTLLLEMYRASDDAREKRVLLEYLVIMDSDEVWQLLDQALDGGL